jgi:lysophospholipase L1-like esterase
MASDSSDRQPSDRQARSRRGLGRLFVPMLALAGLVAGIALAELAAWALFEPLSSASGRYAVSYLASESTPPYASLPKTSLPRVLSHPYLLYANAPGWSDQHGPQHDDLGYRGGRGTRTKSPGVIRILALGGSTTYGWGVEKPEQAWPSKLERLLGDLGHRVEVINAGLPYATSAELLAGYAFRPRYLEPDVVLVHTGGNDVGPMLFPGYEPEYTHFRVSAGWARRPGEGRWLAHSHLVRLLYARWLKRAQFGAYVDQPMPFRDLDPRVALQRVRETEPTGFSRNLAALSRLAKADGAQVLLVSFVQAREDLLTRNRPDLLGLEAALVEGERKTRVALGRVSDSEGVPHLDLRSEDFEDAWFVDNCHLDVAGQARKAELIAKALTPLLAR